MNVSKLRLSIFASSMFICLPAMSATVTFMDDTFLDGSWSLVNFEIGGGGTSSAAQEPSGGNPGSYRQGAASIPSGGGERRVFGFIFLSEATYDPQTLGAIASIDYSEDAIIIAGSQTVGMAIRQDDRLYAAQVINTFTGTSWTDVEASLDALAFGLFESGSFDSNQNPDFSATASVLEFGFIRGRGTPAGGAPAGAATIGGIDNWSASVNPVPLPPAALLLASALVGVAGASWRKTRSVGR